MKNESSKQAPKKALRKSNISSSIENIKKWVDEEIGYYDERKNVSDAIDDMLHDFKTHFLKIDLDETFENEKELIEYFKSEWKQYYN